MKRQGRSLLPKQIAQAQQRTDILLQPPLELHLFCFDIHRVHYNNDVFSLFLLFQKTFGYYIMVMAEEVAFFSFLDVALGKEKKQYFLNDPLVRLI